MSEVRRGEDVLLGRPVAIKLLLDYGDPRSVARFQQEAQILARLQHPNVITVFDSGVDGGDRFIVMELVDGPTLRELLDTEGRLPPERAGEIASRLASALGFAHGKAVIHRDVKPSNVLLPPDGGVKLADMGIARLLSPEALTATLSVRGTALYISPEQVRGDRVDGRADLYSLGCVLFEMLAGRTPFDGDLAALSYAHTHTAAPRVRSINSAVPAAMDELVAAMLEKDPARRPPTGEEVQRSLAAAMRQDAVAPTALMEAVHMPPSPMPRLPAGGHRRRGPKAWPTGVLAVCGLAVLLFIALLASREPDGRTDASRPSPQPSGSPATQQPSPVETSSPAPDSRRRRKPLRWCSIPLVRASRRARSPATSTMRSVTRSTRSSARPTRARTWTSCSRRSTICARRCPKPSRRARSPPQTGHRRSMGRSWSSRKPFATPNSDRSASERNDLTQRAETDAEHPARHAIVGP